MPDFPWTPWFWFAYQLLTATLMIWTALLLKRRRNSISRMILAGALVGGIFGVASRTIFQLSLTLNWPLFSPAGTRTALYQSFDMLRMAGSLGVLVFLCGLLLHAHHGRSKSKRIAELESIIRELQENPQRRGR